MKLFESHRTESNRIESFKFNNTFINDNKKNRQENFNDEEEKKSKITITITTL